MTDTIQKLASEIRAQLETGADVSTEIHDESGCFVGLLVHQTSATEWRARVTDSMARVIFDERVDAAAFLLNLAHFLAYSLRLAKGTVVRTEVGT